MKPALADPAALRVFLADDHPVVLAGIKALVQANEHFVVVGEASDGRATVRMTTRLKPDILILDISMPELNGLKVAEMLAKACPSCKILVLTVHEDRGYVRHLLGLGVCGYLLKRSAAAELIRALDAIAAGGLYLDPAIASKAVGGAASRGEEELGGGSELSSRETEVIRLTASGHSNKSVATTLGIGVKSVETYKARAMDKLGFRSRVELVRFAVGKGWLAS
jgi:DNA-binding NarL/FixJ family response regulator